LHLQVSVMRTLHNKSVATMSITADSSEAAAPSQPQPLVLGGPLFASQLQQCDVKLAEATAALGNLMEQVAALRAAGAPAYEAAVAELLSATEELQEAFDFIDVLAHNVKSATALVDATERRLETLEAGLPLPASIANLPPVQFVAHQFTQNLQRRERAQTPELPELSQLPPVGEQQPAFVGHGPNADQLEIQLEEMAREAAARASSLASTLQEKARLYAGPGSRLQAAGNMAGSFFSQLVDEVAGAAPPTTPVARRPSTPTEMRVD